ncbi:MAG: 50S ribosomal protein L6 [Candidatus Portnoybacteria bacterium]|nr:50S ribosomal protein L6 [Candidatus Portnoybacteria bacterium]
MSKIGKQPINIPDGVEVKISGNLVSVKGPKGELKREIPSEIKAELADKKILVSPASQTKRTAALWGLTRQLLANMVIGASQGFEKKLELQGVGYKVSLQGKDLSLSLGFSHPIIFSAVPGAEFKVEKNIISVSGMDKELIGQIAADIRKLRKPEPYKGKGIRYVGEAVKMKAGKKAVKGGF